MTFTMQHMQEILSLLQATLKTQTEVSFTVLNPDEADAYAGKVLEREQILYTYRGYRSWVSLASLLGCKMLTPIRTKTHLVTLTFVKLSKQDSFHLDKESVADEKYGEHSSFSQIQKMEEPSFLYYYLQALENVHLSKRNKILNLGINRGDEFESIKRMLTPEVFATLKLVGVDYAKSAIEVANKKFKDENITFYHHDINTLESLHLGRFDLLISIGTLQSTSLAFKKVFMSLVQTMLEKDAALILGFPNARWVGGEMLYGAKVPHYAMSEMGMVLSDIIFCKKYLQQHKYRVTITGKEYLFLTATKIV